MRCWSPWFDRLIERYFKLDSYYRIEDKPVFCIYLHANLVAGLGGLAQTEDALAWMRRRCVEAGLPGLHLQTIAYDPDGSNGGVEAGATLDDDEKTARSLAYDSATSYQFCHDAGGEGDYVTWADTAMSRWDAFEEKYGVYYPHVSIGWDNTQRNPSIQTAVVGATPDAFEACLWRAKRYIDSHPGQTPLVTINSWNEWTEGSYLLPDMRWGYRYLQAVRNVFGAR